MFHDSVDKPEYPVLEQVICSAATMMIHNKWKFSDQVAVIRELLSHVIQNEGKHLQKAQRKVEEEDAEYEIQCCSCDRFSNVGRYLRW